MPLRTFIFACLFVPFAVFCAADGVVTDDSATSSSLTNDGVTALYRAWQNSSLFNTQALAKDQLSAFVKQAQQLCKEQPDNPQACALSGLIQSFYATQVSNLQGLKVAKQARDDLQHALTLDPKVYNGEAYAELGMLYHLTPGWPFSFGSQVMAEHLLHKALEIDPQGVMSNLRLGEFLYDQKHYQDAQQCLQAALMLAQEQSQHSWLDFQLLRARQILTKIQK